MYNTMYIRPALKMNLMDVVWFPSSPEPYSVGSYILFEILRY